MSSRPAASFAPVPIENEATAVVVHPVRYEKTFKGGFSTSICDLFQNPYERSSCCALTCCGTCLQDRNEYLLRGEMPPPWWIRLLVYGGGTVGLLILGIAVLGPLGLLVPAAFLTILGIRATQLRMKVRKEIIARLSDDETPLESDHFCAEHRRAHRICACIRNDVLYQQTSEPAQEPIDSDFCSSLWQLLAICCCGCCGCWWNALGMCATAQETRELRKLLPVEHFYIDYVTMQPYRTYYPAIEDLRRSQNGAFWSHLGALSRLSAKLIRILLLSLLILLVASTLHIVANFSIAKVIVVVLTLGQAVVVLYLVHWRKHRFDLSLDAVIKLFASGFVFAMIVATLVEIVLEVAGAFLFDLVFAVEVAEDDPDYDPNNNDDAYNNQIFSQVAQDHLGTVLVFVFFQAFVVAALVEELTKYLCFWMVEHPDFVEPSAHRIETADSSDSMERQQEPSEAAPAFRRREHQGIHSIASAITVGMVALAAGFACVENLLYVFAEGKSFSAEITVLLVRSALPVHPICAAIQSIGIVRRDVEGDRNFQLGKALLPAVILHGTFDFVLIALAVVRSIESPDTGESENTDDDNIEIPVLDYTIAVVIALLGVLYYWIEARKQRNRLSALESTTTEAVTASL